MTTITMFLTITLCILVVLLFFYFLVKPTSRTVATAPSILTSIGIFGTFLGIAIGLMGFNPDDVMSSVPTFLGGIKLAFWSSVVGILTALIIRVRFSIYPLEEDLLPEADLDESAVDSLNRMRQSLTSLEHSMDTIAGTLGEGFEAIGTSLNDVRDVSRSRAEEPTRAELISHLDALGDKVQTALQSVSDTVAGHLEGVGSSITEQARMLGEELEVDGNILTLLKEFKDEMARNALTERNAVTAQTQKLLEELAQDAKSEAEHSDSLVEAVSDLNKQIAEGSELTRKAPLQKLEQLFGELSRSNTRAIGDISDMTQNLVDQAKWQNENIAENLISANDASTKSMLAMLKDIMVVTEDSNSKISSELAKLRTDVAANVRATTEQSKALIEQLHAMTESYKASLIATTTELKAQISKDMKASYGLIDKYTQNVAEMVSSNQVESIEHLEAIANIMQGVVTSATDMSTLLHNNTATMNRIQEAFVSTNEGSLGRLLLNMNENVISQLASLQNAFEAQGPMAVLMKDLNTETLKSLRSLEKALESSVFEMQRIPKEIVKGLQKANKV